MCDRVDDETSSTECPSKSLTTALRPQGESRGAETIVAPASASVVLGPNGGVRQPKCQITRAVWLPCRRRFPAPWTQVAAGCRLAKGAGLAKSRREALGKCLSLWRAIERLVCGSSPSALCAMRPALCFLSSALPCASRRWRGSGRVRCGDRPWGGGSLWLGGGRAWAARGGVGRARFGVQGPIF